MAPKEEDLRALNELISSTLALLRQFGSSLSEDKTATPAIPNPPNPLDIVRDAAKLLKAHTTKLSLLGINKPFTPTAIAGVLRELSGTCLPAMMSVVQICEVEKASWGTQMTGEVHRRVRRVFREVQNLLEELQSIASGNEPGGSRRDCLSSTGVVWEACDALIELEQMGIAGLAVQKAEQYRDSIKDAIEELQEWKEGTNLDTEGHDDELLDSGDEGVDGDTDSLDDLFNAANSMPQDRPELKKLVESAEARLKKIVLLYTALVKRRFKTFKGGDNMQVAALDKVATQLYVVQTDIDDTIASFYDLDEDSVKEGLEKCTKEARIACESVRLGWDGKEDEFTAWSKKWEEAVS
ncbi:uncharacterized protein RCC_02210 [Ramularia collo-cygni]|uniref:Cyclin-D1-binding protein 1-like N-terminal domain-containing protein n=1 Tax=Ramularia collo-cygni TaxID=112498 RepID=A0A2D3UW21_9PEZI|nr:uncharacterized protein RCC_02210 [Ramularia collo-cygni]CZT16367.1 uncharacterized protein RCC_02210 [Ramularia collo-cygni]